MDTKTLIASLLTGAVLATGATLGTQEVLKEKSIVEGEEISIIAEVPAIQPIVLIDDKCGEDSLKFVVGLAEICSSKEVYNELKQIIIEDIKTEKFDLRLEDGTICEEKSEKCKEVPYTVHLQNQDLFYTVLIEEMMKDGVVKQVFADTEEGKAELLSILENTNEESKIIK